MLDLMVCVSEHQGSKIVLPVQEYGVLWRIEKVGILKPPTAFPQLSLVLDLTELGFPGGKLLV